MAKTSQPYGLSFYNTVDSNFSGTLIEVPIASGTLGNILKGDPVTTAINGDFYDEAAATPAIVNTTISASGKGGVLFSAANTPSELDHILGVFQGLEYTNTQGQIINQSYWQSGMTTFQANLTAGLVNIDAKATIAPPNAIYKIQAANIAGVADYPFATIQDAKNYFLYQTFNFYLPNGNADLPNQGAIPNMGLSTYALDASDAVDKGPLVVVGIASTPQSNIGNQWTDPYPDLLVKINPSFFLFNNY